MPLAPGASLMPPAPGQMYPPALHDVDQLSRLLTAGSVLFRKAGVFAAVLPALADAFSTDGRQVPLRAVPKSVYPADVLAAGFPTVPLAAISDALAVTAVTEALALALPAKEGASPPWLQTIAQVGPLFRRSPAMPWTVAYLCRPDDGGPAGRARAALCPYWNSAACRVTVFYSAERLADLGATNLRSLPDPGHFLKERDAALRARVTHGCFSAVRLAAMFGHKRFSPGGYVSEDRRPLRLTFALLVSLRHFADTVAMRKAPCDEHDVFMAADLVIVSHDLFQ